MKLSKTSTIGMILIAGFMFTGCSSKVSTCEITEGLESQKNGRMWYVQGIVAWSSPSAGYNMGTRNLHALQNAADVTLKKGFKYFAIIEPHGPISNLQGSLINTAEEYMKACMPSALNPFTVGQNRCGFTHGKTRVNLEIEVFSEQPSKMLTYDAQAVKDYLIKTDNWREDGITEDLKACPDKYLERGY